MILGAIPVLSEAHLPFWPKPGFWPMESLERSQDFSADGSELPEFNICNLGGTVLTTVNDHH
jgi:hypothetical protein